MTPEERQELRDWSAEKLMGYRDTGAYYYTDPGKERIAKKDWTPDLDSAPASQILSVIDRMRELGLYLTVHTNLNSYTAVFRGYDSSGRFWSAPAEPVLPEAILKAAMATKVRL